MIVHDDYRNDNDDMEYSDEGLERYYDGEWSDDEIGPYVSGDLVELGEESGEELWGEMSLFELVTLR